MTAKQRGWTRAPGLSLRAVARLCRWTDMRGIGRGDADSSGPDTASVAGLTAPGDSRADNEARGWTPTRSSRKERHDGRGVRRLRGGAARDRPDRRRERWRDPLMRRGLSTHQLAPRG